MNKNKRKTIKKKNPKKHKKTPSHSPQPPPTHLHTPESCGLST